LLTASDSAAVWSLAANDMDEEAELLDEDDLLLEETETVEIVPLAGMCTSVGRSLFRLNRFVCVWMWVCVVCVWVCVFVCVCACRCVCVCVCFLIGRILLGSYDFGDIVWYFDDVIWYDMIRRGTVLLLFPAQAVPVTPSWCVWAVNDDCELGKGGGRKVSNVTASHVTHVVRVYHVMLLAQD